MDYQLEWKLSDFIGTGIGTHQLPVVVLRKAEERFKEVLNKWEIRQWFSEYLEDKRNWEYCEKHGHDVVMLGSHITPESGSEWWECRRCGYGETIRYY